MLSILNVCMCAVCRKRRRVTYFTEPFPGPVIRVLSFLERSRDARRSFGATCAGGPVVSIASCEAPDSRSGERCLRKVGFVKADEAFDPTRLEVEGTSLAAGLAWLLPELATAAGAAALTGGRAALAAPTVGAGGRRPSTLCVAWATACGRCSAAPCCTTSANDGLCGRARETRCRASRKLIFSVTLIVRISFSFFHAAHVLEYAGWAPSQFAQWASDSVLQSSVECPVVAHFAQVSCPRQLWDAWPNLWHLKQRRGFGIYALTRSFR